jgi:hypothetical protein
MRCHQPEYYSTLWPEYYFRCGLQQFGLLQVAWQADVALALPASFKKFIWVSIKSRSSMWH